MQASAPAFVPCQAQELSPYTVGDARNTMQCTSAPMMWPAGNCNMLSLDAYSDDDEDAEPCPSKVSQKDEVSTFDGSNAESDTETREQKVEGQDLGLEAARTISVLMLLQLRGKVDVSKSKPIWRMQSWLPTHMSCSDPSVEAVVKAAPWRKVSSKAVLRPPPGLEDMLLDVPCPSKDIVSAMKSPCPSTCDGSGASCSGESDSETPESDSETSDQELGATVTMSGTASKLLLKFHGAVDLESKRPWKRHLKAGLGLEDTLDQAVSVDKVESKRPWRKHQTATSTSLDESVEVALKVPPPWRKAAN